MAKESIDVRGHDYGGTPSEEILGQIDGLALNG
jgi:hypothetical protein